MTAGRKPRPTAVLWREAVRDSVLPRTSKAIALALSTYMDGAGAAYPAVPKIARAAGVTPRCVQEHLPRIVEAGFLVIVRSRGGAGMTHRFQATIPPETVNGVRGSVSPGPPKTPNGKTENGERRSGEVDREVGTDTDWRDAAEAAPASADVNDDQDLDEDAEVALERLVDLVFLLGGGDGKTEATLRRQAAGLGAAQIDYAADQLRNRDDVRSVGAYTVGILQSLKAGYSGFGIGTTT